MLEEVAETLVGPWGIAAILVLGTQKGRKILKQAAKEVVKVGMVASEKVKEVAAELQEEASDVVAEAKAEREEHLRETAKKQTANSSIG